MTAAAVDATVGRSSSARRHDVRSVTLVELGKLIAQARTRIALALCVLGPFAFGALVRMTGTLPVDTVFGRQVLDSAPAVPLVVLGFAGSWAIPLLVSLVAGDIVSSEDHHGTWSTVLTRSCSRRAVLAGKVLAATAYTVVAVIVLAGSSIVAGLVFSSHRDLIGLSGSVFAPGHATALVVAAWAGVLPSALAFAGVAIVVSVATRNSLAGIVVPAALGLLGQLLTLVDGAGAVVAATPSASFLAWHGLFEAPQWTAPLWRGVVVSGAWFVVTAVASALLFARRLRRRI